MAAPAQEETRAIIKFCVDLGKTPTETMKMMKDANRSSNVSRSLVFKWHKRFSEGRESLKDDTGRGRKRIVNAGTVAAVKSRKENPQKLTQLSSRSHPRHLVGKRTAQKDITIDTTSDSQVNSYFLNRWSPASVTFNNYFYLFLYLYIT